MSVDLLPLPTGASMAGRPCYNNILFHYTKLKVTEATAINVYHMKVLTAVTMKNIDFCQNWGQQGSPVRW